MSKTAAILLAGGRGSRMGGVNKPLLEVGGTTLLDAAISAARDAGADPIVVAGPRVDRLPEITWVREHLPFGGPVAAILTALPLIPTTRTLVLACDLPRVVDAVRALCDAPFAGDGVCLVDATGRMQWLTGLYRTAALRAAAAAVPDEGQNASAKTLLGGLAITGIAGTARRTGTAGTAETAEAAASDHDDDNANDLTADIDTWDDLEKARRRNP